MVKYTRLWETMQRKGISQYRLIKTYGISNGQLNRLRKNLYISTHTVEPLCRILDCRVEDVMEIVFDENEEPLWSPGLEEERQKQEELEEEEEVIAEMIQKQGGDYLFAVKGNQGRLNKAFEEKFPLKELNNPEHDSYAISEKSHGREEIRLHIVCDVPDELIDFTFEWKGLKKLCVAVSFRSIIAEQKKEPEMTVRYYISSADLTAEKFATAIRNHWHVENKLNWRLDVVMNEDDCKIRRGNAAELFSGIRHIAINILTNDKVFKAGLRRKMRKAAMDRNYLASVLTGSGLS